MKGKILLAVVVGLVILWQQIGADEAKAYYWRAAGPDDPYVSIPKLDLHLEGVVMTFYNSRDEIVLQTEYTGRIDVFSTDVEQLYAEVSAGKAIAGEDYIYHGAPRAGRGGQSAYVNFNDWMFRAMGGPQGSLDTSPDLALPAPDD